VVKTLTSEFVAIGQQSTNLGLSLQNLGTSYVTMVLQMTALVKALENKVEGLGKVKGLNDGGSAVPPVQTFGLSWVAPPAGPSGPPGVSQSNSDTLHLKVNAIEKEIGAGVMEGSGSVSVVGAGGYVRQQIEQILAQIEEIESRVLDKSIAMDGRVFSSLKDVKLW
jgi:hypothetical protein